MHYSFFYGKQKMTIWICACCQCKFSKNWISGISLVWLFICRTTSHY